ncbi:PEP-CTERM sorting domain-containing protein [Aestuariibacter sp. GS-14]|uniref:PEP-CTERM sorting domain-containing protein n=1 Tax=Aestuariibacter sp. GS-14 TaxID=2590670 RepID=UPI001127EEE2|nr:PEP-CTERM sorting domain-containing protein [Aestuariibacter sp. GS-14]TPV59827.1 PEP-CTERM sorting domain-containing protein [Aestuariibacter sp. GS-14]
MKKWMGVVASLLMVAGQAQASLISTTFASNNGQAGNMFDVVNLIGDVTVTGLDLNLDNGTHTIEVYTKSGSYSGFETTSGAWSLIGSSAVVSSGANVATFFDVADFVLSGFTTTALYITANNTVMNYTNGTSVGSVYADNGELQILQGVGKGYLFDSTFSPRIWNGTIYYQQGTISSESTPAPAPAALMLLALGLVGIASSRKRVN